MQHLRSSPTKNEEPESNGAFRSKFSFTQGKGDGGQFNVITTSRDILNEGLDLVS